eukprot:175791_1
MSTESNTNTDNSKVQTNFKITRKGNVTGDDDNKLNDNSVDAVTVFFETMKQSTPTISDIKKDKDNYIITNGLTESNFDSSMKAVQKRHAGLMKLQPTQTDKNKQQLESTKQNQQTMDYYLLTMKDLSQRISEQNVKIEKLEQLVNELHKKDKQKDEKIQELYKRDKQKDTEMQQLKSKLAENLNLISKQINNLSNDLK